LSCYNYTSYTAVSELSTHPVKVLFYNPQSLSKMSLKFAEIQLSAKSINLKVKTIKFKINLLPAGQPQKNSKQLYNYMQFQAELTN
jgi:hypothetical protein